MFSIEAMARLEPSVLLALSIIDQARTAAKDGRMPRTRALRLALAHAFAHSNGDRTAFDAFWRSYAQDYPRLPRPIDAATQRSNDLTASWNGLLHALATHESPQLRAELAKFDIWQERENKALLQSAIRENRRAREYAKDARECHSPNGLSEPRLIAGKR